MKTLMITTAMMVGIVISAAHAGPLPDAKPDEVGFAQQGLTRIDNFFAREIAAKRVPGAVVAIARDGKLVHFKAYGQLDPAKGTPMPEDAIFALASMTKPMAAVAGLTLMEQGRLPLRAKLADYYPGFADMKVGTQQADGSLKLDAQAAPIYIHDLYRHTSGLMYGGRPDSSSPVARAYPDGTAPAIEGDTQAFIDRITKLPLAHQPGTVFEYGFSIDVLGAVVEKVSEQRLGDYLAGNVWQPLGMKDATFKPTEAQRPRLARPFANDPLTGKPQAIKLLDTPTKSDCGGACAFATVGDYVRFGQMLLNGGELDGQRVLGPKTVHHMISNHLGRRSRTTSPMWRGIAPASASASAWRFAPARACRRFPATPASSPGMAPTARSSSPIRRSVLSWWSEPRRPANSGNITASRSRTSSMARW